MEVEGAGGSEGRLLVEIEVAEQPPELEGGVCLCVYVCVCFEVTHTNVALLFIEVDHCRFEREGVG